MPAFISKDELLEDLKEVSRKAGAFPPSKSVYRKYGEHSTTTLQNKFGSWNDAVEEAGFDPNENIRSNISREELLSEIKRLSAEELGGRSPSVSDMKKFGEFSETAYYNQFGSWNNALREAELSINKFVSCSEKELISELQRLSKEIDMSPTRRQMDSCGRFSSKTYMEFFGSWSDALQRCDIPVNEHSDWVSSASEHPNWKGGHSTYYGESWYSSKQDVRDRDGEACRVCGKNTEVGGASNPDIHHIKPVRKWDIEEEHLEMNDPSNLISLCRDCHVKLEGKWQDVSPDEFARKGREYIE